MNSLYEEELTKLRDDATKVYIYLISGIRLDGIIESFDEHCILLEGHPLVLTNAIATIQPVGGNR